MSAARLAALLPGYVVREVELGRVPAVACPRRRVVLVNRGAWITVDQLAQFVDELRRRGQGDHPMMGETDFDSIDTDTLRQAALFEGRSAVVGLLAEIGQPVTGDRLESLVGWLGREAGPDLMWNLHVENLLADGAYRRASSIWSGSEFPNQHLPREEWRTLFSRAGYCVDGEPAERPTEHLKLWRGSAPERRDDWSWTDDPETADSFARRGLRGRPIGHVWTAYVAPWRLFARENGRTEAEYIVDTEGLDIELDE